MIFTYTPKNTPTSVAVVAASSNQCGISQGQAPSLSRGNDPCSGGGEGPCHPGNPPRFGHRRTGLPRRNLGLGHQQHQEQLSRGQFPTALTSLVSYSPCCSLCRCISFCAELRNCAISRTLISSPALATPRTSSIGLPVAFRFCAVSVRNLRNLPSVSTRGVGNPCNLDLML